MSRQYPYLSDKQKVKNIVCEICKETKDGFRLEWQVSWFRGEDEYEKICADCLKKREAEEREKEKEYIRINKPRWEAAARRKANFWKDMKKRLEAKYQVKYLTEYHWRINDIVDIYPVNRRYHNLKTQERGDYSDMHKFLKKQFAS